MKEAKKVQKAPEPPVDPDDALIYTMMSALDWYFHVTTCRDHSNAERVAAFHAAHESFLALASGDTAMDAAANAPTSNTVH
jgi:hypothetical protein